MVTSALCLSGCFNPRNTLIFRKLAEQEDQKLTKYTEEALKNSPGLQELDLICSNELPLFYGFVLRSKIAGPVRYTSLSYAYDYNSGADYQKVKGFYLDYFARNGWQLVDEYNGGWGPKSVKFRKNRYKVVISHGAMGDVEYAIDCEKLSDSGEALPNNLEHL